MATYQTTITADASGDGVGGSGTDAPWTGRFHGLLRGVRFEFTGAAATTDVTISEPDGLQRTIATSTDSNTNATTNPAFIITGATDAFEPYYVEWANLRVTVAQAGDGGIVTCILLVDED